ncbi:MAG: 16S rRNA (guanine(527)-N(7))-methyltransferase RsmG [Clostridia bacterium]|nr:16S rRNA (guanine(527)-N(7))-methyltransferase RsmG [Clostridia bacterium]
MSFNDNYCSILSSLGLGKFAVDSMAEKFCVIYEMLVSENQKYNLTSITDEKGVIIRHFADSLTAVEYIRGKTLADVGCGGGFPCLPIAVAMPEIEITAIDSTAKKLGFVDCVSGCLGLNVKTVNVRAEEMGKDVSFRGRFENVISRAVARLNILAELSLPLVRTGGRFIALKGSEGAVELKEAEKAIKTLGGRVSDVVEFELGDAGKRSIIIIEKVFDTPQEYPRSFAKIKKNPL